MLALTGAAIAAAWCGSCARRDREAATSSGPGSLRRLVVVEDGAALGVGRTVHLPEAARLDGGRLSPASLVGEGTKQLLVIAMTSASCPVSRDYGPRLAAMEHEYTNRGAAWVYVNAVDAESLPDMRDQVRKYGFGSPYFPDTDHAIGRALGARTTTEVFVLDRSMRLVYRGGVDDQFGIGSTAGAPTRSFLRAAIESTLAGRTPEVEATYAPGCLVDFTGSGPAARSDLTYHGRIAGILASSCTGCHVAGGAAPFALTSLEDLRGRASMIAAVVRDGLMPPTHGLRLSAESPNPWRSPRTLSEPDRADLLAWLESGMPAGPPVPSPGATTTGTESQGWTIGNPEQVLMTPMVRLSREGPLQRSRSLVPLVGEADLWVRAIEFKPVKPGSVLRAYIWLLPPGGVLPNPGRVPEGLELVGTYSPGFERVEYRPGSARRLPGGSALVVEMVSKPMGRDMGASLRIGLKTLPSGAARPEREVRTIATVPGGPNQLPPGARVTALTPVTDAEIGRVQVEVRGEALLDADRIDPRWVVRYELVEPIAPASGTRIGVRTGPAVKGTVRSALPEPEGMGTTVWVEIERAAPEG